MPPAARGGGGEAGTCLPALARRAQDRDRETRAPASIASAVYGRRAGSVAKGRGLGRPGERSLRRGPVLNYVNRLHMRRSPPACGGARSRRLPSGHPGHHSGRGPRRRPREDAVTEATTPRPQTLI